MNNNKSEIAHYLKKSSRAFIGVGIFSFIINLLMLTYPLYMLQVYDRVLVSRSESTLLMLIIIAVGLLVIMGILDAIRARVLVRISGYLSDTMMHRVFRAVYKLALYQNKASAEMHMRDLDIVRQFVAGAGTLVFFDLPWAPIFIGAVFLIDPALGWLAAGGAIFVLILAVLNDRFTRQPLSEANKYDREAGSYVGASMRNSEVLEAMGMLPGFLSRWSKIHDKALAYQAQGSDRGGAISGISKSFRLILQVLILGVGAYLAIDLTITAGMMIAASIIASRGLAPIDQTISTWRQFVGAREAYARLNKLLAQIPEDEETMPLPRPKGVLTVTDAFIGLPSGNKPILKNIKFDVQPGQILGLIGSSASGKSTLARALVGVWPASAGSIRLDGVSIYQWNAEDLGPYIGYLPQDVELFAGTVAENISRFPDAPISPESVVDAAQKAGVHEMILSLPNGYETDIGAEGGNLSSGQRQRVALARALFGDPAYVVLDEPNSNLDDAGDRALRDALLGLKKRGACCVIISHRPATMSVTDKLLVLKDGMMQKYGPTKEVVAALMPKPAGEK